MPDSTSAVYYCGYDQREHKAKQAYCNYITRTRPRNDDFRVLNILNTTSRYMNIFWVTNMCMKQIHICHLIS